MVSETIMSFTFNLQYYPMKQDLDTQLIKQIPDDSILTPHIGEFRRLVGHWNTDIERQEKLRQLSVNNKLYIILKGAHSAIACPNGDIIFNSTGNSGMATAGSGDVLTGIITSFLSQGYFLAVVF